MKKLYLLKKDFEKLITNKTVFVIFAVSMLVSAVLFTYLYGNSVLYMTARNKKSNIGFRTYECSIVRNHDEKICLNTKILEEIENCFSDFPVEDIFYYSSVIMTSQKNSSVSCGEWKSGKTNFTDEQVNSSQNVIFVSDSVDSTEQRILRRKGDIAYFSSSIDGTTKEYEIAGEFSYWDVVGYIPYTTFIKENMELTQIRVITSRRLNSEENNEIIDLFNYLPVKVDFNPMYPHMFKDEEMTNSMTMIVILALIYILALVSYLYMAKYIIESNKYYYNINSLLGAKRVNIAVRLFFEFMILLSVINIFAIVIHYVFYNSLFTKINMITNISYFISDYIIIFFVLTLLAVLVVLPYSFIFTKSAIVDVYRKGG